MYLGGQLDQCIVVTLSYTMNHNLFSIANAPIRNEMITVPEGTVKIGKPVDFPSYGWDNEYGHIEMK